MFGFDSPSRNSREQPLIVCPERLQEILKVVKRPSTTEVRKGHRG
jgi:hypothetical protein